MNRVTRGSVMLAAALSAISCSGDPTSALRNGLDHLLASPTALFLTPGKPKTVVVTAVDAQGNTLATTFTLNNTLSAGAGITVVRDDSFNLVYNNAGQLVLPSTQTSALYTVSTTNNSASSSFTVSAGGKSITIPVRINPDTAASVTLSAIAPALGDTVTVTAAPNYKFTPASVVTIPGAGLAQLPLSADSTQIKFLPGPSANARVSVSKVILSYAPSISFTATSGTAVLTTSAVPPITPVFSTSAPNVNDVVTVTAPGNIKFLPSVRILFGNQLQLVTSVAADSNSFTFRASEPGASGVITVQHAALNFLPSVGFNITTTNTVTVGSTVIELQGTGTNATAPLVAFPLSGEVSTTVDAPSAWANNCAPGVGFCRVYTIVVTDTTKFDAKITWNSTTDLGLYWLTPDGKTDIFGDFACDNFGVQAGGPESCTETIPPGTYLMAVPTFTSYWQTHGFPTAADPTQITIVLTAH